MKLDLVVHELVRDSLECRRVVVAAMEALEPYVSVPSGMVVELAVTLVGSERMRELNKQWRGADRPTDVLSFPLRTPRIAGYTSYVLGDLFICPAVVRTKAREFGRSPKAQMQWTVVHGLLHLAGYDHEKSDADAEKMAALEQEILSKL